MRIIVNGRSVEAPEGASVGDVIKGEPYVPGTMAAIIRPMDKVRKETEEFKFSTTKGAFVLKLERVRGGQCMEGGPYTDGGQSRPLGNLKGSGGWVLPDKTGNNQGGLKISEVRGIPVPWWI